MRASSGTRMRCGAWMLVAMAAAMLSACARSRVKPRSSVRPYEVVVVADRDSTVVRALTAPAWGLPQPEPLFDVRAVDRLEGSLRYARSIVVCSLAADTPRVARNRYARPQIIVTCNGRHMGAVVNALNEFELRQRADELRTHANREFESEVRRTFGFSMSIPADMKSAKRAKDFFWMSDNSPEGMQSLVVVRGDVATQLRRHLKGATDRMYMRLMPGGLWEMEGDAMGGPYRSRRVGGQGPDSITCVAFVYAPEGKKRNLMRQLEAALYTIKK